MKYDIVIIGGGTAGWLSAAFLSFHNPDKKICLIESPDIPTIGVGEGTWPTTMHLLNSIGISPKELLVKSNGSLKVGIKYVDFSQKDFWLSVEPSTEWEQYGSELIKNLGLMNKSPVLNDTDFFAMHFIASDFANLLKEYSLKNNVTYLSANVLDSQVKNNICSAVSLDTGVQIQADWFLDCSGFAKILIKKTNSNFVSYENELLVDSAVVGPTQYKDQQKEFSVYTQITAKESGWIFKIPTQTRIGNGYVYSSKFISPAQAQEKLASHSGVTSFKHLKMQLGYYDQLIVGNIVAVGLSGGFIEPMEATAIHITERTLIAFNDLLAGKITAGLANSGLRNKIRYIKTLILGHYAFSERKEPFWQAARSAARSSNEIVDFLDSLKNKQFPTKEDELDVAYPYCQWNDLLRGFNQPHYYPNINIQSKKDIYLATYYLPNHHEYITNLRKAYE
jgi:tryptophan halogenase